MNIKEAIISFIKRKWWYLVLLILSTSYVFYYRNNIYQLKELNATNLIFILWLILLLLPLFSEMEFFGIKFKKEVENAKAEVKESLNDLRMQIMDIRISNSNANTINFGNGLLPTEQKLKELIEEFITNSNATNDNLSEEGSSQTVELSPDTFSKFKFDVPQESIYLFKVRLMLEKTLTDLCEKTDYNGRKSMYEMMKHLSRCEILNGKTVDLISQIIKIANRGVHGELISKEYIDFISQVIPELQKQLDEANSRLHYCICPRCKYSGYSRYENACPRCGFMSDDY
ncbi:hypothetical protein DesLBE_4618 [Desulfitobacterium sp. LBE]|uniref:hypothetical protein n=1 Tax=Desulfitobacterium sp. LBE TaxID=884086 RepID=UPI001199488C|nr:hypothetical protein [Desulfitobacterium sp. LBE]TWH60198.1 hypothetical protein DesLBE_4618 [Desulfitobacterium sp. LBE]